MVLATLTLTHRRRDKFAAASESFVMSAWLGKVKGFPAY